MFRARGLVSFVVSLAATLAPSVALANPRPLPFTYQHEQLAEDASEIEQFVDLTPVRASNLNGDPKWYGLTQFTTEYEHGLSDRLELGLYVTFIPNDPAVFSVVNGSPEPVEGNGLKQRLRYQLAPTNEWPIDVGLYGELAENDREIEIEAKVILQHRFGPVRIVGNATVEQEFYYDAERDFVLTPSAGVTVEATPSIQPGIEWWMLSEYPEKNAPATRPFELGPHEYVGPALLVQFGRIWWTNGIYYRVSDTSHTLAAGEPFGNLWFRSVIGVGL